MLDDLAGGLEYAEQPCATLAELAALRSSADVPIAVDEAVRLADELDDAAVDLCARPPTSLVLKAPRWAAYAGRSTSPTRSAGRSS